MSDLSNFTAAHDLAERLSNFANVEGGGPLADTLVEAADLIELFAHRINHLTNVNDGLRETLDSQRTGLAELRAMLNAGQPA